MEFRATKPIGIAVYRDEDTERLYDNVDHLWLDEGHFIIPDFSEIVEPLFYADVIHGAIVPVDDEAKAWFENF